LDTTTPGASPALSRFGGSPLPTNQGLPRHFRDTSETLPTNQGLALPPSEYHASLLGHAKAPAPHKLEAHPYSLGLGFCGESPPAIPASVLAAFGSAAGAPPPATPPLSELWEAGGATPPLHEPPIGAEFAALGNGAW